MRPLLMCSHGASVKKPWIWAIWLGFRSYCNKRSRTLLLTLGYCSRFSGHSPARPTEEWLDGAALARPRQNVAHKLDALGTILYSVQRTKPQASSTQFIPSHSRKSSTHFDSRQDRTRRPENRHHETYQATKQYPAQYEASKFGLLTTHRDRDPDKLKIGLLLKKWHGNGVVADAVVVVVVVVVRFVPCYAPPYPLSPPATARPFPSFPLEFLGGYRELFHRCPHNA